MKRALMLFAATVLILSAPRISRAQYSTSDDQATAAQYNDVDDGQLLKMVSYAMAPVGYMLEWTVTRPLHYAATNTPLAPMLSGDTQDRFFGQTDRAAQLPAGTFTPFQVSPYANTLLNSPPAAGTSYAKTPPPQQTGQTPYYPGGQSAPSTTGSAVTPPGQAVLH
jgi:hypothetical protein